MAQVDTVVPNSLNYTDIKPQSVENQIMLCRYQPTSTITGAKGGDLVKFLISGNGFLDPYSTYFSFTVTAPDLGTGEVRFLDRSAHSFFQRIVIRSQGVEIERLEQYDVMCAMINDMVYSPEQCTQHFWEGFPTHQCQNQYALYNQFTKLGNATTTPLESIPLGNIIDIAGKVDLDARSAMFEFRDELYKWLCQGSSPSVTAYIGETAFHNLGSYRTVEWQKKAYDIPTMIDVTRLKELGGSIDGEGRTTWGTGLHNVSTMTDSKSVQFPISFAFHEKGVRTPSIVPSTAAANTEVDINTPQGTSRFKFVCPIYSGILGLLMPEKKLLPLNLLPLDIEIVFNPNALYTSIETGNRSYTVSDFYIYGNTFFFEQEIHRTLEASVADHGLFIYCNSFHYAPLQLFGTQQIPSTVQIGMNLKSINSVHWVFMYTHFETQATARKLHFVSHNLYKLQLLNGTQLIPQYPIEGNAGTSRDGSHLLFFVELLKAWNKLHDPARDGALHSYNWCGDQYAGQMDALYWLQQQGTVFGTKNKFMRTLPFAADNTALIGDTENFIAYARALQNKQGNVGRCQYGISLEGEELGSDHTMITGRKSQYPFCLQMWTEGKWSERPSYMITFLRADFIVYIRPDLQVVTLGK